MAPGMGQSDDSCSWLARSGLGVSKASPLLVSVCARPLCSFLLCTGEVEVFLPYAHSSFMDECAARTAAKPNGSGTPTASTAKRGGRTGLCVGARSALRIVRRRPLPSGPGGSWEAPRGRASALVRLLLGGLLSSRTRFRFTGHCHCNTASRHVRPRRAFTHTLGRHDPPL